MDKGIGFLRWLLKVVGWSSVLFLFVSKLYTQHWAELTTLSCMPCELSLPEALRVLFLYMVWPRFVYSVSQIEHPGMLKSEL